LFTTNQEFLNIYPLSPNFLFALSSILLFT
jgi:hypothetical protein